MIKKVLFSPFKILGKIHRFILIHKYRKEFLHFGERSFVDSPLALSGKQNISIGDNVRIAYKSWLAAVPLAEHEDCKLDIYDGCVSGANSVVTHDIPDYCVAVGVSAKVIKRVNFITQQ